MKRLMYLIPISIMAVLVFGSIALAQSAPDQSAPDPYGQGGTDPSGLGSTDSSAPTPNTATNTQQTVTVPNNIEPSGYLPQHMQVAPGTTVEWFNDDASPHTVTADDGSFDSGELKKNQSYSVRFDVEGKWHYHSTLDPDMIGTVTVATPSTGDATAPGDSTSQPTTQPTDTTTAQPSDSSTPTTGDSTTQPSGG